MSENETEKLSKNLTSNVFLDGGDAQRIKKEPEEDVNEDLLSSFDERFSKPAVNTAAMRTVECTNSEPASQGIKSCVDFDDWDILPEKGMYACVECNLFFPDCTSLQNHIATHVNKEVSGPDNTLRVHTFKKEKFDPSCRNGDDAKISFDASDITTTTTLSSEQLTVLREHSDYSPPCKCSSLSKSCSTCYRPNQPAQFLPESLHNSSRYRCAVCPKSFLSKKDVQEHERTHDGADVFICSVCNKKFPSATRLTTHINHHTAEKNFECQVCQKTFSRRANLEIHMRVHTGEKPYACTVCGRAFSIKAQMQKHHRTHTGERPYKCPVCDKAFNSSSDLKKHRRTHTGEKPFECSLCDKTFSCKVNLKTHIRFHTGSRPYGCETCGKGFMVSSQLVTHRRIHTGEKPYKCPHCDMEFVSSSDRKRHIRVHSGEKPYKCSICQKAFSHSATKWRHEKTCVLSHKKRQAVALISQKAEDESGQ